MTMLDFNLWTWNSRVFPGIDSLNVRLKGDRVRIRIGNLTMTNHPIHLHGHEFEVTGTDGGWTPKSALAEVTDRHRRSGRCGRSSSSPTSRATGRSTATRATTR
jgi:FtsP/CotA-like multicopper oxidase with cupredoxin domain